MVLLKDIDSEFPLVLPKGIVKVNSSVYLKDKSMVIYLDKRKVYLKVELLESKKVIYSVF